MAEWIDLLGRVICSLLDTEDYLPIAVILFVPYFDVEICWRQHLDNMFGCLQRLLSSQSWQRPYRWCGEGCLSVCLNIKWSDHLRKHWQYLLQVHIHVLCVLAFPLLGIYSVEIVICVHERYVHICSYVAALFVITKNRKLSKCPSTI